MKRRIFIIGAGFSSVAASCYLARYGYDVTIVEKNSHVGGRARQMRRDGFVFDMGPTWYWMPDVFERFFADFGKTPADYYELQKLNPAYSVYFNPGDKISIPDNPDDIADVFERVETGSGRALRKFLSQADEHYRIAIGDLVYKPGESISELVSFDTITRIGRFVGNVRKDIRSRFRSPKLVSILEFPVLFLGAKPQNTPSFYNFMNHADFGLGTWYAKGGMASVVSGMERLSRELGVKYMTNANVSEIRCAGKKAEGIVVNGQFEPCDIVLSGADYHHTERLLPEKSRGYSERFWKKKTFAPSALLFYVGFDKKLQNVDHHTLFFDTDFDEHAFEIYDSPSWPSNPLFYASFPSITDTGCAPDGYEAGIFLIPLAPDLEDSHAIREIYFEKIMLRLEKLTRQSIKPHVLFKESFCVNDFRNDYNSYKGNAYGLANTLLQTAVLRPKIRNRKVRNLFFTGQLTVPGPGVPPALISGKLASELIKKHFP
ncbi:phytoene desaturase [Flavobacterium sp. MAH-1]|uniref:Phytoene desaturase n=1 Tax=Flavobacterium agri TaxID=2743471 RepID=A0A7Y9C6D7_9FLAO|nr:phytoene desaturase family protein [Flavobacterium agri]NUY81931.1 phytoene desaturase [Flavobacterium agri]NYA71955.1 phytoene desaturase [Flavobacterium agri]